MKTHILLVDDEVASRKGMEFLLKEDGVDAKVTQVGGVREFWRAYRRTGWDLILLDMMLPASESHAAIDIDAGTKIVADLQRLGNSTPVVVVTSRWRSDPVWRAIKGLAFIKGMVFKPIDETVLCAAVRKALCPMATARNRDARR